MEIRKTNWRIQIWLTEEETFKWASRWPCSAVSGKRFFAEFDKNGLCDLAINGKSTQEITSAELGAITSDFLISHLDRTHPLYNITVGQFKL